MGKKTKGDHGSASEMPVASPSPYSVWDDDDRLLLRQKFLTHDYKKLWMETRAKKKMLMRIRKRKLQLLAEVGFLNRKLKSFSQTSRFKIEKTYPDNMLSSPSSPLPEKPTNSRIAGSSDRIQEETGPKIARTSLMLELNQIFFVYDSYSADKKSGVRVTEARDGTKRVKWRNPVVYVTRGRKRDTGYDTKLIRETCF